MFPLMSALTGAKALALMVSEQEGEREGGRRKEGEGVREEALKRMKEGRRNVQSE